MGPLHLALSPAVLALGDLGFLPVLLGWISPTPYSRFFSPARCISSSRPVDFFPSHSVIFLPTCSSSSPRRVLMSLRNGVDMSAVLVVTSSTFYLPSSFGGSVRNIGDNRTYFFFYRRIFIISSSGPRRPRGFIYPPPWTSLKCFSQPTSSFEYFTGSMQLEDCLLKVIR